MSKSTTSSASTGMAFGDDVRPETTAGVGVRKILHEIIHELGPDLEDTSVQDFLTVEPSAIPTLVDIKSTVRARGARGFRSAPYLATVRRREAHKIAKLIEFLPLKATDEEVFIAWTHEPLDRIRGLIDRLSTAEEGRQTEFEGNSCEILRQLRDTFLEDRWQAYRQKSVSTAVASVLTRLATQDEITAADVYTSLDALLDAGLNPTIGIGTDNGEEEEILD
jgi:hypothetical protein